MISSLGEPISVPGPLTESLTGQAFGNISCGWLLYYLQTGGLPESPARPSYRVIFHACAVLGLLKFIVTFFLSGACEIARKEEQSEGERSQDRISESSPLLPDVIRATENERSSARLTQIVTPMSRRSIVVLVKLLLLFSIDSLASGLVPQ